MMLLPSRHAAGRRRRARACTLRPRLVMEFSEATQQQLDSALAQVTGEGELLSCEDGEDGGGA